MNVRPFVLHTVLAMTGTFIIGASWNSAMLNETVFAVFVLILPFYFFAGFLLNNYGSLLKNLISVSTVLILGFICFLLSYIELEQSSIINILVIVYNFPFLFILGWSGVNYPLLEVLIPPILLFCGLESKLIIRKLIAENL